MASTLTRIAFDNSEADAETYDAECAAQLFREIVNPWKRSAGQVPDFR